MLGSRLALQTARGWKPLACEVVYFPGPGRRPSAPPHGAQTVPVLRARCARPQMASARRVWGETSGSGEKTLGNGGTADLTPEGAQAHAWGSSPQNPTRPLALGTRVRPESYVAQFGDRCSGRLRISG